MSNILIEHTLSIAQFLTGDRLAIDGQHLRVAAYTVRITGIHQSDIYDNTKKLKYS